MRVGLAPRPPSPPPPPPAARPARAPQPETKPWSSHHHPRPSSAVATDGRRLPGRRGSATSQEVAGEEALGTLQLESGDLPVAASVCVPRLLARSHGGQQRQDPVTRHHI